jgi:3-oxoacyl-[acyl-carrier-protein] synthase II
VEVWVADRRRVAVTGIGAVTPIGIGRERLWDGLRAQRSAVRTVTRFDPSPWRSHNAAEVNDFDAAEYLEWK